MATLANVAYINVDSSTPRADQDIAQGSRTWLSAPHEQHWGRFEISGAPDSFLLKEYFEEAVLQSVTSINEILTRDLQPIQEATLRGQSRPIRSLVGSSYLLALRSVVDVCNVLNSWGEHAVAERLAYLASDEDLEDGESPATPESARAFLSFFSAVASEGKLDLACSPEGEISAVWRFSDDQRRACVWFHNAYRVSFAATDANGNSIRINDGSDKNSPSVLMEKLVQAGLLKWHPNKIPGESFAHLTTYLDIVASAGWETMASHWRRHSYLETMSPTSPPTGSNTFTPQIDHSNLPASASP